MSRIRPQFCLAECMFCHYKTVFRLRSRCAFLWVCQNCYWPNNEVCW